MPKWGKGRERERERDQQASHYQFGAWCGLEPMNYEIMTWTEIKSWTLNWLSHPGTPPHYTLICSFLFSFLFSFLYFPIYLSMYLSIYIYFILEREREWGRGAEGKRERISSRLPTLGAEINAALHSMTLGSWTELKSKLDAQVTEPHRHP